VTDGFSSRTGPAARSAGCAWYTLGLLSGLLAAHRSATEVSFTWAPEIGLRPGSTVCITMPPSL
jgi:hypothetical protein